MSKNKYRAWDVSEKKMISDGIEFELRCLDIDWGEHDPYCAIGHPSYYSEHLIMLQCTGLADKNGVEIYFDSLINVFFTSGDGEHYHDCVYRVVMGSLGIEMQFESLLWQSGGRNQYPLSTTLCERFGSLKVGYFDQENRNVLIVPDSSGENHLSGERWKESDESMYFEVIGTAQENPELLSASTVNE